ncbi:Transcription initiation factor TFIID subunit 10, partial [Gonapodya sp. JEL0774]
MGSLGKDKGKAVLADNGVPISGVEDGAAEGAKVPRADEEMAAKERSLAEFLVQMDEFAPVIPDAVTDYYLSRAGFECDDVRIKRLLALAAQKFISDIATDALQTSKVRQQGPGTGRGRPSGAGREKKAVLTMEDLAPAVARMGVNPSAARGRGRGAGNRGGAVRGGRGVGLGGSGVADGPSIPSQSRSSTPSGIDSTRPNMNMTAPPVSNPPPARPQSSGADLATAAPRASKLKFMPTVRASKVAVTDPVPENLSKGSSERGRGGGRGGGERGRGRGRGRGAGERPELTASGPFALGPAARPSTAKLISVPRAFVSDGGLSSRSGRGGRGGVSDPKKRATGKVEGEDDDTRNIGFSGSEDDDEEEEDAQGAAEYGERGAAKSRAMKPQGLRHGPAPFRGQKVKKERDSKPTFEVQGAEEVKVKVEQLIEDESGLDGSRSGTPVTVSSSTPALMDVDDGSAPLPHELKEVTSMAAPGRDLAVLQH